MPRCLLCLRETDDLSNEHIYPAALGGKLELKNSTCVDCNNGCSEKFEQSIAERLKDFRYMFRIPDRYGKTPEIFTKVVVDGEEHDAKLLRDGDVQLKPKVSVIKDADGITKEVVYEHVTELMKEKLRKQALNEKIEIIEDPAPAGKQVEVSISGFLDFIDSQEMLRVVSKIAYIGLASRTGAEFAASERFNRIREFIRTGSEPPTAKLFLNEPYMAACGQGPHQHSIVVAGRRDVHRVHAIVRLFGGLCYLVELAQDYEGADFTLTMAYDAQRGEEVGVLVSRLDNEILQVNDVLTSKNTIWNDRVRSGEWFVRFVGQEIERSMRQREAAQKVLKEKE